MELSPDKVKKLQDVTMKISTILEEEKVDLADVQKILTSLQMSHTNILMEIIKEKKDEASK